jgi:glycosyltransferase involved in cell wall biosynthesis
MPSISPRVTIGVPVYNGARFLAEAIDSLLAQTMRDFRLVISDNASTDETEEICRAYARADERVDYHRSPMNRGASWNFNHLVHEADTEYFKWAAHDDVCAPEFLERCIEVLDADPSVVLCSPNAVDVDADGNILRALSWTPRTDALEPHVRYRELVGYEGECHVEFGVIRRSVLAETGLIRPFSASDRVLFAELALRGRFHVLPEPLFLHREHEDRTVHVYRAHTTRRQLSRAALYDPMRANRMELPTFRVGWAYIRAVTSAPVSRRERLRCYRQLPAWVRNNPRGLVKDVIWAARQLAARLRAAGHRTQFAARDASVQSPVESGQ